MINVHELTNVTENNAFSNYSKPLRTFRKRLSWSIKQKKKKKKKNKSMKIEIKICSINCAVYEVQSCNTRNEPPHDKTNELTVRPVWSDQIWSAVRSVGSSGPTVSSCGQRRLCSDWADAQADLSLRCPHMPFCWFCHEAAQMSLPVRNCIACFAPTKYYA